VPRIPSAQIRRHVVVQFVLAQGVQQGGVDPGRGVGVTTDPFPGAGVRL
jgi:hypothetical protein